MKNEDEAPAAVAWWPDVRRRPPAAAEERSRSPGGSGPRRPVRMRGFHRRRAPGGSVPPVDHRRRAGRAVRPGRGRGASSRSAAGRSGGVASASPSSSRGKRNPSVSGSGPMTKLIDASATGALEGPGGGGGYPENAAAFWPRGQEGRARRRTGGGSLSRTSCAWPLHRRRAGPSRPWATAARRGEPSVPAVDAVRRRGRLRDGAGARRAPARRGAPGTPRAASFEPRGTQPFRVR